jgi:hypothetical protein
MKRPDDPRTYSIVAPPREHPHPRHEVPDPRATARDRDRVQAMPDADQASDRRPGEALRRVFDAGIITIASYPGNSEIRQLKAVGK